MSLLRIAVLIPCHNEAIAIAKVVCDFRAALPEAAIFVYDNNSSDDTYSRALAAGAITRREYLQGKGNVVRRMFADVEADVYVLVDGDDTYDAAAAPGMVAMLLRDQLDVVNGMRIPSLAEAYRRGHRFGNSMLSGIVQKIFGARLTDLLSGYRVFSRRFVKSFPAGAYGFETETELTVHALELRMPVREMQVAYKSRPEGSSSKLRTYSDGLRILRTILILIKEERPLQFFGAIAFVLFWLSIVLGIPVIAEFLRTGLVPRFPTAILATGIMLLSFMALVCGMILDSVANGRKETKRMAYLSIPLIVDVETTEGSSVSESA